MTSKEDALSRRSTNNLFHVRHYFGVGISELLSGTGQPTLPRLLVFLGEYVLSCSAALPATTTASAVSPMSATTAATAASSSYAVIRQWMTRPPDRERVAQVRAQYDAGEFVDCQSPEIVFALLKAFFRELPTPLIPSTMYEEAFAIVSVHLQNVVALLRQQELYRLLIQVLGEETDKVVQRMWQVSTEDNDAELIYEQSSIEEISVLQSVVKQYAISCRCMLPSLEEMFFKMTKAHRDTLEYLGVFFAKLELNYCKAGGPEGELLVELAATFAPYLMRPTVWIQGDNIEKKRTKFFQRTFVLLFLYFLKKKHNILTKTERVDLDRSDDEVMEYLLRKHLPASTIASAYVELNRRNTPSKPNSLDLPASSLAELDIQGTSLNSLGKSAFKQVLLDVLKVKALPLDAGVEFWPGHGRATEKQHLGSSRGKAWLRSGRRTSGARLGSSNGGSASSSSSSPSSPLSKNRPAGVSAAESDNCIFTDWDLTTTDRATKDQFLMEASRFQEWLYPSALRDFDVPEVIRDMAQRIAASESQFYLDGHQLDQDPTLWPSETPKARIMELPIRPNGNDLLRRSIQDNMLHSSSLDASPFPEPEQPPRLSTDSTASQLAEMAAAEPSQTVAPGRGLVSLIIHPEKESIFPSPLPPPLSSSSEKPNATESDRKSPDNAGGSSTWRTESDDEHSSSFDKLLSSDWSESGSPHIMPAANYDYAMAFPRVLSSAISTENGRSLSPAGYDSLTKARYPYDLEEALLNHQEPRRNYRAENCEACSAKLGRLLNRRRFCNYCGRTLCTSCCDRYFVVPWSIVQEGNFLPQAVCGECENHLQAHVNIPLIEMSRFKAAATDNIGKKIVDAFRQLRARLMRYVYFYILPGCPSSGALLSLMTWREANVLLPSSHGPGPLLSLADCIELQTQHFVNRLRHLEQVYATHLKCCPSCLDRKPLCCAGRFCNQTGAARNEPLDGLHFEAVRLCPSCMLHYHASCAVDNDLCCLRCATLRQKRALDALEPQLTSNIWQPGEMVESFF